MSLTDLIPGISTLKLAGVGLGVAFVVGSSAYLYGTHRGAVAERNAIEAKAAKEAFERIQEMENSNEKFRALPARDRCLAFARDSGLSLDICDD